MKVNILKFLLFSWILFRTLPFDLYTILEILYLYFQVSVCVVCMWNDNEKAMNLKNKEYMRWSGGRIGEGRWFNYSIISKTKYITFKKSTHTFKHMELYVGQLHFSMRSAKECCWYTLSHSIEGRWFSLCQKESIANSFLVRCRAWGPLPFLFAVTYLWCAEVVQVLYLLSPSVSSYVHQ